MSEEKETATVEDRLSLASVCIWEGSSQGSKMLHFSNTAVNVAGRGSDVADTDLNDVYTTKKDDGISSHRLLVQSIT